LEPDPRIERLADLRAQLKLLTAELEELEPGTPERWAVQKRWGVLHGSVLALADELRVE
jgi:hypothetical protein